MAIYLNVVCLVSAMNDFLEARILYDKCTEKKTLVLHYKILPGFKVGNSSFS